MFITSFTYYKHRAFIVNMRQWVRGLLMRPV